MGCDYKAAPIAIVKSRARTLLALAYAALLYLKTDYIWYTIDRCWLHAPLDNP